MWRWFIELKLVMLAWKNTFFCFSLNSQYYSVYWIMGTLNLVSPNINFGLWRWNKVFLMNKSNGDRLCFSLKIRKLFEKYIIQQQQIFFSLPFFPFYFCLLRFDGQNGPKNNEMNKETKLSSLAPKVYFCREQFPMYLLSNNYLTDKQFISHKDNVLFHIIIPYLLE